MAARSSTRSGDEAAALRSELDSSYRRTLAVWLPAGAAAALLLSIAFVFFGRSRRIDARRDVLVDTLDPTKLQLVEFELSLLEEVAIWRSYQLRPNDPLAAQFSAAQERTHSVLDQLRDKAALLGSEFSRELAELRQLMARLEAAPSAVVTGQLSLAEFKRLLPQREGLANQAVAQAAQLDRAVSRQMQRLNVDMQRLEQTRLTILALLFPGALGAIGMTAWFGQKALASRKRTLAAVADEGLLRDAMAALTGAEVLPTALNRIAAIALRMSHADGVFIEHADSARNDVEVVAASGTGTPPVGVRIPFRKSITNDLVRLGTRELVLDLSGQKPELRSTVPGEWAGCSAIAVSLQHNNDVGGALVLVQYGRRVQPHKETLTRLWALGGLAALALHRQELAAELHAERARLEAVVNEMPVGVVLADAPSGRVVEFNRHAVQLWGSPSRVPQAIEEYGFWNVYRVDGQPYEARERPLARSILNGEIVRGEEAEIERPDGTRLTVLINSTPIRDEGGAIIAGVAAVSDISAEKKRQQATAYLDEISRQLASTLDYDATMEAILHLMVPRLGDFASLFHRAGGVILRMWAASGVDEKLRHRFDEVDRVYPLPLPSPHPVAVAIRTGKPQLRENVTDELLQSISRDDRQLEWLRSLGLRSVMALPLIVRGETIGALQIVSVNRGRHYHCEDLAFAEEIARRAALALDNAQLLRTVKQQTRAVRFLSNAALSLSGSLEYEEVLQRVAHLAVPFLADFALTYRVDSEGRAHHVASAHRDFSKMPLLEEAARLYRPDVARAHCTVIRALSTGQPVVHEEITPDFLNSQGFGLRARELFVQLAPVSWMTVPFIARDRTLGTIVCASTQADRRYGSDEVALAQRLASRAGLAIQNAMLYRDSQDAVTARDEVLAIVSHDLRNPLHTIGMSAQVLLETPLEPAAQRKQLEMISRAKDRMDGLIQDLLDITRVAAGKGLPLERGRHPTGELIRESCESFVTRMAEKEVRFEWNVAEQMPDVFVDSGRIQQVLSNLIGNALKFTPPGGRIVVRASEADEGVLVSVQDTGSGIPQDDLEQVFQPFWQAPRLSRQGAGLGLAISRSIIDQHGGRIWVESREGAGSQFFFTLPVAQTNTEARAAD